MGIEIAIRLRTKILKRLFLGIRFLSNDSRRI